MNQNYKNSYKVTEKELVSLSVYNVGFKNAIHSTSGVPESAIII